MQNTSVQYDTPSGCNPSFSGPGVMSQGPRCSIQVISPNQAANIQCALRVTTPDVGFSCVVRVDYRDQMQATRSLNANISFSIADFLRPVPGMAVAQFGQQWQNAGMVERKAQIPNSNARTAEQFMQRTQAFGIQPIQAIGTEAVAVGKLIGLNVPVLMHGKTGAQLEVLIRTPDKTLSELVQSAVRNDATFK